MKLNKTYTQFRLAHHNLNTNEHRQTQRRYFVCVRVESAGDERYTNEAGAYVSGWEREPGYPF